MMRSNGFGGRGAGRLAAEAKEKLPPPEEGRGESSLVGRASSLFTGQVGPELEYRRISSRVCS